MGYAGHPVDYRPLRVALFRSPIVGTDARGPLARFRDTRECIYNCRAREINAGVYAARMRQAHLASRCRCWKFDGPFGSTAFSRVRSLGQKGLCVFGNSCPPSPFPSCFILSRSLFLSLRIMSNADVPSSLTSL